MINFILYHLIPFPDHKYLLTGKAFILYLLLLQEIFRLSANYTLFVELHDLLKEPMELPNYEILEHEFPLLLPLEPLM